MKRPTVYSLGGTNGVCAAQDVREYIEDAEDQLQQARHAIAFAQKELADYRLRIAHALGMYYSAEGHAEAPCSDDDAVNAIAELQRQVQNRAECWHCGDVLIPESVPHCEDCPPFPDCGNDACEHCSCNVEPEVTP